MCYHITIIIVMVDCTVYHAQDEHFTVLYVFFFIKLLLAF